MIHLIRIRRGNPVTGLFILSNPSEWKWAGTAALVLFLVSLALALTIMRDQRQLATEINAKTFKAADAIKNSPQLTNLPR